MLDKVLDMHCLATSDALRTVGILQVHVECSIACVKNGDSGPILSLNVGNCVYFIIRHSNRGSSCAYLTEKELSVQVTLKGTRKRLLSCWLRHKFQTLLGTKYLKNNWKMHFQQSWPHWKWSSFISGHYTKNCIKIGWLWSTLWGFCLCQPPNGKMTFFLPRGS